MTAVVPAPFQTFYRLDSIVASTTQTQAGAYQLTAPLSRVITSATAGNAVALPKALVGLNYLVINDAAANAIQVYGTSPDTINGVATATGISQPAGTAYQYTCTTAGAWITKDVSALFTNLTVSGLLTLSGSAVGTFVATAATAVTVANTLIAANSLVLISLNTPGGTVGAQPHLTTLTAGTSFSVIASASDTSTYTYAIVG